MLLDSDQSPEDLATAINAGLWIPPASYLDLLRTQGITGAHIRLYASCHGSLVIVTPNRPLENQPPTRDPSAFGLTRRQRQVLRGLVEGYTTKEIAFHLGIQPRTVYMHIAQLKMRCNASTRAESVDRATSMGLVHSRRHPAASH
jgi:DNA-binding NarL/FixJ family response regulator